VTVIAKIEDHFPLGTVTGRFGDNGKSLKLTEAFRFVDGDLVVDVAAGFVTDFNSVPRGLWNFFPPWEFPEAGVVHDFLYRSPGQLSRGQVDDIHGRIMEIEGAGWWLRRSARMGLRLGGWKPWRKYRKAEAAQGITPGPKAAA
jgi:uncharacterized protein DUF1353